MDDDDKRYGCKRHYENNFKGLGTHFSCAECKENYVKYFDEYNSWGGIYKCRHVCGSSIMIFSLAFFIIIFIILW